METLNLAQSIKPTNRLEIANNGSEYTFCTGNRQSDHNTDTAGSKDTMSAH